jgi:hypothetical protein
MTKNEPLDKELYKRIKRKYVEQYKVPSAYRIRTTGQKI